MNESQLEREIRFGKQARNVYRLAEHITQKSRLLDVFQARVDAGEIFRQVLTIKFVLFRNGSRQLSNGYFNV